MSLAGRGPDVVAERRLAGRLRAWATRRWTRRGLALLLVALGLLLLAPALSTPWRWLLAADGSVFTWLGLAGLAGPAEHGWPWALAAAAAGYTLVGLALAVAGTPSGLAIGWPYLVVQAALACPLDLPYLLG